MNEPLLQTWWIPAARGAVGLSFGALAWTWPDPTLLLLAALFAGYALLGGGVSIAGAAKNRKNDDAWWLVLLLGLASVGAGAVALGHPGMTALILLLLIGANALLVGVLDVAVAIRLRRALVGEPLLFAAGIVSILFAVFAFLLPGEGTLDRLGLVSVYALVTGALLLAAAFHVRRWAGDRRQALADATASEAERAQTAQRLQKTERLYRLLWETTTEAICIFGSDGVVRYVNPGVGPLLGYAPEELVGRNIAVIHPDIGRLTGQAERRAPAGEWREARTAQPVEQVVRTKDGREVPVEAVLSHVELDGEPLCAVFYRDITDRKRAQTKQAEYTARLQALARASLLINRQPSLEAMLQAIADEARAIIGAHQAVVSLTTDETCAQAIKGLSLSGKYAGYRTFDTSPDGSGIYATVCRTNRPVRMTQAELERHPRWRAFGKEAAAHPPMRGWLAVPLVGRGDKNIGLIMLSDKYAGDFTADDEAIAVQLAQIAAVAVENMLLLEQERRLEEKYRSIFENTIEGIFQTAPDGRFLVANPAFARMLEYDSPQGLLQLTAEQARQLFVDAPAREELLRRGAATGVVPRFELEARAKSGTHVWLAGSVRAVRDRGGNLLGYEWTVEDITERKKAERQIAFLARHDPLTGLPNRYLFAERAALAVGQARSDGTLVAVLVIDLDRFKIVNETLGHAEADELLKTVATRLRAAIAEHALLARLGSDEFALLVHGVRLRHEVDATARTVQRAVRAPLEIAGRAVYLTASIGISVYPLDAADATTLLKHADLATYRAKQEGRDTVRYYVAGMERDKPVEFDLEVQLRGALERDELALYYQPYVNLADESIVGVEALVRWMHPTEGLLSPSKFIPLAEETELIVAVGDWALRRACRQKKAWAQEGLWDLRVAVNLSVRQLNRRQLPHEVAAVIEQAGITPKELELEVTETSAMQDAARTIPILQELKDLGVAIAIDDFGTGYSSLSYLKHVPAHYLKIDQTFVRGVSTDPADAEIIKTIIRLAKTLGFGVIAEGVQTAEQARFLRAEGCELAQGFFFSRPLPAAELEPLLQRRTPTRADSDGHASKG